MRSLLTFIIFALTSIPLLAQAKMTDREMDGLSGPVKTVREEWKELSGSDGDPPKPGISLISETLYTPGGNLSEVHYDDDKTVYSIIDGVRTFKVIEKLPKDQNSVIRIVKTGDDVPLEKTEKITKPDPRFDGKTILEFDNDGRVITEREIGNDGKIWHVKTFKYGADGKLIQSAETDSVAITTLSFKYNAKGLLIESVEERNMKGNGVDSTTRAVYSDQVVDGHGNWTSRKEHSYYSSLAFPKYKLPPEKWEMTRMQYRTITYY